VDENRPSVDSLRNAAVSPNLAKESSNRAFDAVLGRIHAREIDFPGQRSARSRSHALEKRRRSDEQRGRTSLIGISFSPDPRENEKENENERCAVRDSHDGSSNLSLSPVYQPPACLCH
jgi:hypothetical protein